MTNKLLRLGFTESCLLYTYYLVNYSSKKININNDSYLKNYTEIMLKWFYSTSGFYDKSIFNINIDCLSSKNYINYMETLIVSIKNSTKCVIYFHEYINGYSQYFNEFVSFLNNKVFFNYLYNDINKFNSEYSIFNLNNFMENRSILIINPISELMFNQYKSGNVYKANDVDFPIVKNIILNYYK